jgi:copper(I)-binding protein
MKTLGVLVAAAISLAVFAAAAPEPSAGAITITSPWMRATPKGATVGGAYMTIANTGTETDCLIGAASTVAAKLEVHRMSTHDGVMMMRPVEGGLEIKPGETVILNTEPLHIMLIGLKRPLVEGDRIPVTLEFSRAGKVEVRYLVEAVGALVPRGDRSGMGATPHVP